MYISPCTNISFDYHLSSISIYLSIKSNLILYYLIYPSIHLSAVPSYAVINPRIRMAALLRCGPKTVAPIIITTTWGS